jgi:hypothetical protein
MEGDLVIKSLLMAWWRKQSTQEVVVHPELEAIQLP